MTVFNRKYRVRYSETGVNGNLKIISILNYLQDTACFHAFDLGISGMDLLKNGLGWVIYRYQIKISQYPTWEDTIHVHTWRYPSKNLYELRAFEIKNQQGISLVQAKSTWILIDLAKKKPVRLQNNLPAALDLPEKKISDTFDKVPPLDKEEMRRPFKIRMHDLDLNRHVNNAVFVGWAVETVPKEILTGYEPKRIDVVFRNEAVYGDNVFCATGVVNSTPEPVLSHIITREDGNTELARVRSIWDKT